MGTKYLSVHAQGRKACLNSGPLKISEVLEKSSPARFWSVGSSNDNQEHLLGGSSRRLFDSVNLQTGQTSSSSVQDRSRGAVQVYQQIELVPGTISEYRLRYAGSATKTGILRLVRSWYSA